jgi:ribonuclease P protein component
MLSPRNRLRKRKDIEMTFRGQSYFCPHFVIRYRKIPDGNTPRCTVIVSNKVARRAVARNVIKRRVREVLRGLIDQLMPGDYAVVARTSAGSLSDADIARSFESEIKRLPIFR